MLKESNHALNNLLSKNAVAVQSNVVRNKAITIALPPKPVTLTANSAVKMMEEFGAQTLQAVPSLMNNVASDSKATGALILLPVMKTVLTAVNS